jgi:hypothetical protein
MSGLEIGILVVVVGGFGYFIWRKIKNKDSGSSGNGGTGGGGGRPGGPKPPTQIK